MEGYKSKEEAGGSEVGWGRRKKEREEEFGS